MRLIICGEIILNMTDTPCHLCSTICTHNALCIVCTIYVSMYRLSGFNIHSVCKKIQS